MIIIVGDSAHLRYVVCTTTVVDTGKATHPQTEIPGLIEPLAVRQINLWVRLLQRRGNAADL